MDATTPGLDNRSRSRAGSPTGALAGALAEQAGTTAADPSSNRALIGLATHRAEQLEVVVVPTARHPLDHLLFVEGTHEWVAVGVGATGRRVEPGRDGLAVLQTVLAVGRDGTVHATVDAAVGSGWRAPHRHRCGPPAQVAAAVSDTGCAPMAEGLVVDACRRVLGLSTPPPREGIAHTVHLLWLDALVRVAGDPPARPRDWSGLAELHPLVALAPEARTAVVPPLSGAGESAMAVEPHAARASLEPMAACVGWQGLRRHPILASIVGRQLTPREVAWFDDGMFSRWLPSLLPEVGELTEAVHACYPPALAAAVAAMEPAALAP